VPVFEDLEKAGSAVPVAGVDVEVYDIKDQFDVFGPDGQSLEIPSNGTASREVHITVGRDVATARS